MEYSGTKELDALNNSLNNSIKHAANYSIDQITHAIQKDFTKKIYEISDFIMGEYKKVAYITFQKVFFENYGKNYDVNSLNNSLNFSIDSNLIPSVSYDKYVFRIDGNLYNDKRAFNQNARNQGSFANLIEADEIEALEEIEEFGISEYLDNPYDYATEEMELIEDRKVFKPKKLIKEVSEVYKEAEVETKKEFLKKYKYVIKPYIRSKYGVNLI